ncbi:MAG: mannitol dehydrogenase family protein [Proteobacteria bacterium]|nr:mannitol dehydrogenase family protein [Pseudomonadota bacterium]
MRLSDAALANLPADVKRPQYGRDAQKVGIVHFGIGAFHRAHQAWYTDVAMNGGDRDWMITGVSLRSRTVAEQMNPQDGLYAVAERSGKGEAISIAGAVRNVLVAPENPAAVVAAVADARTHILSFTVTEKGYCRDEAGKLDLVLADMGSFYPLVAQGLAQRLAAGRSGLTLISCDNLADNGETLQALLGQYIDRRAPHLTRWFEEECACPSTMVDRIVPATTDQDRARVAQRLGSLIDEACVVTEPFSQWVIENRFAGRRPRWELAGAELVDSVRPYETAKLRMLNGAHSLLAYCGLEAGHTFVHEAIGDPALRRLAEMLLYQEAAPTIPTAPGQDLTAYAAKLVDRFANSALNHRLVQIAMDGSQKIPQRWLATLGENRTAGRSSPAILSGLRAWVRHITGDNVAKWGPIEDPLAPMFGTILASNGTSALAAMLLGRNGAVSGRLGLADDELGLLGS